MKVAKRLEFSSSSLSSSRFRGFSVHHILVKVWVYIKHKEGKAFSSNEAFLSSFYIKLIVNEDKVRYVMWKKSHMLDWCRTLEILYFSWNIWEQRVLNNKIWSKIIECYSHYYPIKLKLLSLTFECYPLILKCSFH